MYFGIVKDINDPEKLGRVKVKVFDLHDNIKTYELGWSQVMMSGNTPAVNGQGHSVNLNAEVLWKKGELLPADNDAINDVEIYTVDDNTIPATGDIKIAGSLVCGIFLDPLQQEFMVIGSLPTKSLNIEDNNIRARGEADPNANDSLGKYQPASTYAPQYPYNHVYETESGHIKEYDDTLGHERITERHMSGTQYEIGPDGSKIERIVRDNYQLVIGHDTLEVKGNVRIVVSGNADIAIAKDLTANVGGKLETNVTGNMIATVAGTTQVLNTGDMTLTVSGKDSANLTLLSQYSTTEAAGSTTMHKGNIKLDGNVSITGNIVTDGTTTTSEDLILDTHVHGDNNVNQANTAGPANP